MPAQPWQPREFARMLTADVRDEDVPWQHAVELTSRFARDDVVLTLVKDGDHRLSRPEDIDRLINEQLIVELYRK